MLVLSRDEGQQVIITTPCGETIRLRVMEVRRRSRCHRGGRVRLSFDAPPSVIIHREEVADLIAAQEKPAARPA